MYVCMNIKILYSWFIILLLIYSFNKLKINFHESKSNFLFFIIIIFLKSWFCEEVIVTIDKKIHTFPCRQWLSKVLMWYRFINFRTIILNTTTINYGMYNMKMLMFTSCFLKFTILIFSFFLPSPFQSEGDKLIVRELPLGDALHSEFTANKVFIHIYLYLCIYFYICIYHFIFLHYTHNM